MQEQRKFPKMNKDKNIKDYINIIYVKIISKKLLMYM